ncbi:deoxyribodipyrimidine photo-lyase [Actinoplanes campanulatus]|uniref:Deoxyribodipyrimidine photo-lyase n=1 Tax=Actinoplanes campanulatus TaxID=113559 RepID=A0A7W5APJ0_9ACTN|nr:deoxyribodipyrimidine photo-lyase [Actinoplanes campanulatus]MBB3099599.1 deoxyribodipyrimidine photo-lyase [Actinoplanes campanulatus]GGN26300.1 deoxyribodipyrimidine photo-lyase [Actinoplanes campanulatus]GID41491.1 deoxyribodipyrimidine photo-lyase [Actinoplanes campanulatus]
MSTAVVLLTRDLRLDDNPALAAACAAADRVVPLYVLDPTLAGLSPNRTRFLHQSLADLRDRLRKLGGDLVVREGDPVAETIRTARDTGATTITLAADVSGYARRRERRLAHECDRHRIALERHAGLTVVEPGTLRPGGGKDCYQVFTPYYRSWSAARWRPVVAAPDRLTLPDGVTPGDLPALPAGESPHACEGGETAARRRLTAWLTHDIEGYDDAHNDLPGDVTSRLSPYLRWGCLSPLSLAETARSRDAEAFVRQLCWRDFYYQVARVHPRLSTEALRPAADRDWRYDTDALEHWQDGLTGVPIVDAGMRQLRDEGWMHNRARLITAAFLTKHLGIDWRSGVAWFFRWLLDGDVPNNSGNWQWTAGTGNDTRPYRRFNPIRQALRFDPEGVYVRRYVPELKGIAGAAVHQPWRLPEPERRGLDYPEPLESHRDEAVWLRD